MLNLRPFQKEDTPQVIALWQRCGLVHVNNDPAKDIFRKSKVRPDLFIVGLFEEEIVASVMVGYEGHRGWINYLAVSPDHQRKGYGRLLMDEAERLLLKEGWHNNHHRYQSATRNGFYWWEFDPTYYGLKMLSWTGLIWGLKPVPASIYAEAEKLKQREEPGPVPQ